MAKKVVRKKKSVKSVSGNCIPAKSKKDKFPAREDVNKKSSKTPKVSEKKDVVNKPDHYNFGNYQPIDVIADWKLSFNLGNVLKYIARAKYKGTEVQDLKKARVYLTHEIKKIEGK